ncbi:hypothetical protein [Saccharothrix xinjiangensis]|uniref:RamC N-terminal domain-containing protein n=1 Tax=Saccharothrix xinjiangensis TaxID=204798 RepID=A0ABV9XUY4_9PSEU
MVRWGATSKRYEIFCLADRWFYDAPDRSSQDRQAEFGPVSRPVPPGWRSVRSEEWLDLLPPDHRLPAQGWKIHVSACLDNAEEVLDVVWDYCVSHGLAFKYLPNRVLLFVRNAKYAPRGWSGKFITVHPEDEDRLRTCLDDLGAALAGHPGPYVLSDLRMGDGPLHVRYGGFAKRHCVDDDGEVVPAIKDDRGHLVPDRRRPVFSPPEWVALPDFLAPHLEARNAVTTADLPYRIEQALHHSNGGGAYAGHDTRTGERVVLKEARPARRAGRRRCRRPHPASGGSRHAAPGAGTAVRAPRARLVRPGRARVPGAGVHRGDPAQPAARAAPPLVIPDPDPDRVADYTAWALVSSTPWRTPWGHCTNAGCCSTTCTWPTSSCDPTTPPSPSSHPAADSAWPTAPPACSTPSSKPTPRAANRPSSG